jgi:hypothetical protein
MLVKVVGNKNRKGGGSRAIRQVHGLSFPPRTTRFLDIRGVLSSDPKTHSLSLDFHLHVNFIKRCVCCSSRMWKA